MRAALPSSAARGQQPHRGPLLSKANGRPGVEFSVPINLLFSFLLFVLKCASYHRTNALSARGRLKSFIPWASRPAQGQALNPRGKWNPFPGVDPVIWLRESAGGELFTL